MHHVTTSTDFKILNHQHFADAKSAQQAFEVAKGDQKNCLMSTQVILKKGTQVLDQSRHSPDLKEVLSPWKDKIIHCRSDEIMQQRFKEVYDSLSE